jgi:hypothetical protein
MHVVDLGLEKSHMNPITFKLNDYLRDDQFSRVHNYLLRDDECLNIVHCA